MGVRFRKSIPVGNHFRVNLSRRGVGWSAGIPGTGLSYGQSPGRGPARRSGRNRSTPGILMLGLAALAAWSGWPMLATLALLLGLVMIAAGIVWGWLMWGADG